MYMYIYMYIYIYKYALELSVLVSLSLYVYICIYIHMLVFAKLQVHRMNLKMGGLTSKAHTMSFVADSLIGNIPSPGHVSNPPDVGGLSSGMARDVFFWDRRHLC